MYGKDDAEVPSAGDDTGDDRGSLEQRRYSHVTLLQQSVMGGCLSNTDCCAT